MQKVQEAALAAADRPFPLLLEASAGARTGERESWRKAGNKLLRAGANRHHQPGFWAEPQPLTNHRPSLPAGHVALTPSQCRPPAHRASAAHPHTAAPHMRRNAVAAAPLTLSGTSHERPSLSRASPAKHRLFFTTPASASTDHHGHHLAAARRARLDQQQPLCVRDTLVPGGAPPARQHQCTTSRRWALQQRRGAAAAAVAAQARRAAAARGVSGRSSYGSSARGRGRGVLHRRRLLQHPQHCEQPARDGQCRLRPSRGPWCSCQALHAVLANAREPSHMQPQLHAQQYANVPRGTLGAEPRCRHQGHQACLLRADAEVGGWAGGATPHRALGRWGFKGWCACAWASGVRWRSVWTTAGCRRAGGRGCRGKGAGAGWQGHRGRRARPFVPSQTLNHARQARGSVLHTRTLMAHPSPCMYTRARTTRLCRRHSPARPPACTRSRCRSCHPDRASLSVDDADRDEATEFSALLNEIYETLIDPDRRALYDELAGFRYCCWYCLRRARCSASAHGVRAGMWCVGGGAIRGRQASQQPSLPSVVVRVLARWTGPWWRLWASRAPL